MFLTFSNTLLLIGLAGAVVPLVLHLLSRARYQSVEWGAMLFLEGVEVRQQHSTRLNQVILLIVRMMLVALLAIALAQPVLQEWGPDAEAGAAALREADHGQLLCLVGVVACAIVLMALALLMLSALGSARSRLGLVLAVLLAVAAGVGIVSFGRRAAAWEIEVRRLMAQQPPSPVRSASDGVLRPRVDAAILLDCSPSMNFEENGHTRFSLAQSAAKQVLAGLHRGDRVSLLLLGRHQTEAALEPTADLQSGADRIDSARTSHVPADVAEGLLKARDVLDRDGRAARDLYVVCDRQAMSWRGVTDDFIRRSWHNAPDKSAGVRIFVVPIGNADAENVAVESIQLANPPAILGQPAEVEVQIHNYGSAPRAALPLTVWVNGKVAAETTVSVSAGHIARMNLPIKGNDFAAAGPQVISAEIRTIGYRDDDRLETVVNAIEPIRVLVISGDESDAAAGAPVATDGLNPSAAGAFRSEADFLRVALAPLQSLHRKGPDPCKVDVIPEDQWAQADLQRYQVVVLANIERFSTGQARVIEQYVYGGGGLLVAPGNLARIDSYNDELWRDGAGILPAELEDATSSDGSDATTLIGYDPQTPVFQFLHDRPDLMLSPTIGRYFPTNARPSDARSLAWYTSGSPFLIESHAGRGRVLLMTTSLDADWSTLPLSNFYLPFVQSAARYLAAGTMTSHNLWLGEPIQLTLEEPVEDRAVIDLPDGGRRQIPVSHFASNSELRFSDTTEPGIYRVRLKALNGERTIAFALLARHAESDLTQLTQKQWAELEDRLQLKRIDPTDRPIAAVVAGSRAGYDLWPWALGSVLLLATIELALARRWSREAY